jgi:RES domain-containing protein
MFVYRIVKSRKRTTDLSGSGAFHEGGRWNNEGVFALYTSENEALALLEVLVHVEEAELPSDLFIIKIEIAPSAPIFTYPDKKLPKSWRMPCNIAMKTIGDRIIESNEYLALKVRSAVMPTSYNYILNPRYSGYYNLVKMADVYRLEIDKRL